MYLFLEWMDEKLAVSCMAVYNPRMGNRNKRLSNVAEAFSNLCSSVERFNRDYFPGSFFGNSCFGIKTL
jgi:hypothetical protein